MNRKLLAIVLMASACGRTEPQTQCDLNAKYVGKEVTESFEMLRYESADCLDTNAFAGPDVLRLSLKSSINGGKSISADNHRKYQFEENIELPKRMDRFTVTIIRPNDGSTIPDYLAISERITTAK